MFFLLAQAGALAHGLKHVTDQTHEDKPACELCLAYAPLGAGMASTPLAWALSPPAFPHDSFVPTAFHTGFRPVYQSRAPPSPIG